MRIALVGWDLDDSIARGLAGLGMTVVGFTRWLPGLEPREHHDRWVKIRSTHELSPSQSMEERTFGESVVRDAAQHETNFDFDVIHALDRRGRQAALALASRAPSSELVASAGFEDDCLAPDDSLNDPFPADRWICDHPWTALRVSRRIGKAKVDTLLSPDSLSLMEAALQTAVPPSESGLKPRVAIVLSGRETASAFRVWLSALHRVRERVEGLKATVLGDGPGAEILRRRLAECCLLPKEADATEILSPQDWNRRIVRSSVVGIAAKRLVDHPAAQCAWLAGRPVVNLRHRDPERLAARLLRGLTNLASDTRDLTAGQALARREVEPATVSANLLMHYVEAIDRGQRRGAGENERPRGRSSPTPLGFPELRSRLTLTPVSTREVLASWSLRPDDRASALEWLGPDAARSVLTVRLFDVTDLSFNGMNAHGWRDVDLGVGESHRTIGLPFEGRSLAGCLGLRTQWGYFHPIVHSRLCHLPREAFAPASTPRYLRALTRGH